MENRNWYRKISQLIGATAFLSMVFPASSVCAMDELAAQCPSSEVAKNMCLKVFLPKDATIKQRFGHKFEVAPPESQKSYSFTVLCRKAEPKEQTWSISVLWSQVQIKDTPPTSGKKLTASLTPTTSHISKIWLDETSQTQLVLKIALRDEKTAEINLSKSGHP